LRPASGRFSFDVLLVRSFSRDLTYNPRVDLFAESRQKNLDKVAPLAVRMRPRTLEEFSGQEHFLGPGKLLRRMLEADRLMSLLFYGPPGTGKTTLAELIAQYTKSHFEQANAASIGVKDVRAILDASRARIEGGGKRTVLFLDEIHRFTRSQQDILLGDVENGIVLLIGATTENPFFAVNSALVSRSQIFAFLPLTEPQIKDLVKRAIADPERGFGKLNVTIDDDALDFFAVSSDGDARRALTALEIAVRSESGEQSAEDRGNSSALRTPSSPLHINLDIAQQSMQRKAIVYDQTGDEHYDAASALIKSMRGSDPDAAVYWVARMLEAGEDPRFIARRIAILASEDIGNADPRAIVVANAAWQLTERIGMPECQLTLAQAAIYMACAPKSNACTTAIGSAMSDVREGRTIPVPKHLRDSTVKAARRVIGGVGDAKYVNPHSSEAGYVDQDYLGVDVTYYKPTDRGEEARIAQRLRELRVRSDGEPRPDEA
jgi:putative ATPase